MIIIGGFDPQLVLAHVEVRFAEKSIATAMMKWNRPSVEAPNSPENIEIADDG